MSGHSFSQQPFVPSPDVMMTIVFPTIVFCIGMVIAMLIGINRCKQWELDKIVEMRRTRRVIQRITARLREKNFRTIEKARHLRKSAVQSVSSSSRSTFKNSNNNTNNTANTNANAAPPTYNGQNGRYPTGNSPPPSYQDSLLDQLYEECRPAKVVQVKKRKKASI